MTSIVYEPILFLPPFKTCLFFYQESALWSNYGKEIYIKKVARLCIASGIDLVGHRFV